MTQEIDVSDFLTNQLAWAQGYWLMFMLQEALLLEFFVGGVIAFNCCECSAAGTKRTALWVVFGCRFLYR